MSRTLNIPKMQSIMNDFEKENMAMEMKGEMMSDAIDDVMDEEAEGRRRGRRRAKAGPRRDRC